MDNWDDFKFFLALGRAGSLKAAARILKTDQATVGRRIYGLEEKLKTQLFEKRSDGYFLTISGERIRASIEEVEATFLSVDRKITGQDELLAGPIRIAMPGALANHLVIPHLKKFTDQHPQIEVQFLTGGEVVNLAKREADMAFRLVRPRQTDLIVRKVADFSLGLYVAKDLLKKRGKIHQLEDLRQFPFVGLYERAKSQSEASLLAKLAKHLGPQVLTSSAWSSVFAAIQEGVGVGILPQFMGARNPRLEQVSVLPLEKTTLWFVIHPEVQKNKRFIALAEYLIPLLRSEV